MASPHRSPIRPSVNDWHSTAGQLASTPRANRSHDSSAAYLTELAGVCRRRSAVRLPYEADSHPLIQGHLRDPDRTPAHNRPPRRLIPSTASR